MKVGIFTFHRAHNYGGNLQAFALKNYLKELGFESFFIDYWSDYHSSVYKIFKPPKFAHSKSPALVKFRFYLKQFLIIRAKIKRFKKFNKFISNHLDVKNINALYNKGNLIQDVADLYVYGSDQIWWNNETQGGFDEVYWGKFPITNSPKISYAASMGFVDNTINSRNFIKENLKNFNRISVREKELQNFLESISNEDINLVLDPVFLLSKDSWLQLIKKSEFVVPKIKYLLFYNLKYSQEATTLAKLISKKLKINLIEVNGEVRPFYNPFKNKPTTGPLEFLALIYNAEFVISTSFHGVAFSIIFEKQFYSIGIGKKASRVTDLLQQINIPERYLHNTHDIHNVSPIDYSKVNNKLQCLINNSKMFIETSLRSSYA